LDQTDHDIPQHLSPEVELIALESEHRIMDFIQTLDADTKTAFTLREIDGRTYDEIAQILECPIGTVRSRIFRARQLILEFMNQENILNG
jgi:RNA polymerase sigma-70 factor (ECF subfamily)